MSKEIIYIGRVEHKHGENTYTAKTYDAMIQKVATEYVKEWIGDIDDEEVANEIHGHLESFDFELAVDTYFNYMSEQGVEFFGYDHSEVES